MVACCADILGLVGIGLMIAFSGKELFSWACMVAIFGVVLSLTMGVSSRFGMREGSLIVSFLISIIAVLCFNVVYIMMIPS